MKDDKTCSTCIWYDRYDRGYGFCRDCQEWVSAQETCEVHSDGREQEENKNKKPMDIVAERKLEKWLKDVGLDKKKEISTLDLNIDQRK